MPSRVGTVAKAAMEIHRAGRQSRLTTNQGSEWLASFAMQMIEHGGAWRTQPWVEARYYELVCDRGGGRYRVRAGVARVLPRPSEIRTLVLFALVY